MKRSLQEYALFAEILSAVAVVASLVFVGLQIRQESNETALNTRAIEAAAYQDLISQIGEINTLVVKDAEFRFVLAPASERTDSKDYSDVTVKVRGKPPHDVWFTQEEGKANLGDGTIRVCMDGTTLVEGEEIFYIVEVEDVGVLDPRAKVIIKPN